MKSRIGNRVRMMKVVISLCDRNLDILTSIPALAECYSLFKIKVREIDRVAIEQITIIEGITTDKQRDKKILVDCANRIAKALMAYAHKTNNHELERGAKFMPSHMLKARDVLLIGICKNILTKCNDHLTDMVAYGADSSAINALTEALQKFDVKSPETLGARIKRKVNTEKLTRMVEETCRLLRNEMDRLIQVLPEVYADFKELYFSARQIIDYHGKFRKHTSLEVEGVIRGVVTAEFDGSAIAGAQIRIEDTDFVAETDDEGEYNFEKVPAGIYTLKATADTYTASKVENVEVLDGADIAVDFNLEAEG